MNPFSSDLLRDLARRRRDQEVRAERAPQSLAQTAARAGQLCVMPIIVRVRHP